MRHLKHCMKLYEIAFLTKTAARELNIMVPFPYLPRMPGTCTYCVSILNASKNATFTVQPYSRFNAILSF